MNNRVLVLTPVTIALLMVTFGCTYMYRDYYEKGCCLTVEQGDQQSNRPYTHP